ncbi:radical SAM protein [Streptomyces noursei]|uniref:radical SAM protein n=1 Tax=Streptomyces noursei TaxID=1971 RepID=UPI0023B7C68C|nr:radical SAM protein [Streptomyces noursei]
MTTAATALREIRSVELEITGTCNLRCSHCCTESSPQTPAGAMTPEDWHRAITDIAELGIPRVQFIGGEPTLSPLLPQYIDHALDRGLGVEVYSNLVHVRPSLWHAFSRDGVRLATSYYSDHADEHEQITKGRGSHARIRANIVEALRLGIPLRVGIVEVIDKQRVAPAEAELRRLGVRVIHTDRMRKVGRAADTGAGLPSTTELCGRCFRQRVSISPDGEVAGCILSRFLPAGNVRQQPLAEILNGDRWAEITTTIPAPRAACPPDDSSDCDPANTEACEPAFGDDLAPAPVLTAHSATV